MGDIAKLTCVNINSLIQPTVFGNIDDVKIEDNSVVVCGWAMCEDETGAPIIPEKIIAVYNGEIIGITRAELVRDDVSDYYIINSGLRCGFELCLQNHTYSEIKKTLFFSETKNGCLFPVTVHPLLWEGLHNKFLRKILKRLENPHHLIKTLSPTDTMMDQYYEDVGKSAVKAIIDCLAHSNLFFVRNLLDIPCGHGRITRWLRAIFPSAAIDCCDLDKEGVDFCTSTFRAKGIYSNIDIRKVNFERCYDLIWVGSLFTHIPENLTRIWLNRLAVLLSPNGICVATTHGRKALEIHKSNPYIKDSSWIDILSSYHFQGYGFHSYSKDDGFNLTSYRDDYGISLCSAPKFISLIEEVPDIRLYSYSEATWAGHQDVYAFGK